MSKTEKTRGTLYVDSFLWREFRDRTKEQGLSMSAVLENYIKEYLELEEEK